MGKSVLYIEDDTIQTSFIAICLEKSDYDITMDFAHTGKEGVAMFDPERHALAIIDYNLPDAQAPQIAEQIRARQQTLPVLFVSSLYTDEMRAIAKSLDVKLCIEKDKMKESLAVINQWLSDPATTVLAAQ